jgi:hypothetical protein
MRIADPTPVAKGLAVAAACLVGIPAVCRWIEVSVAQSGGYPAMGLAALVLLAGTRCVRPR